MTDQQVFELTGHLAVKVMKTIEEHLGHPPGSEEGSAEGETFAVAMALSSILGKNIVIASLGGKPDGSEVAGKVEGFTNLVFGMVEDEVNNSLEELIDYLDSQSRPAN
jgi:hypothetical protein